MRRLNIILDVKSEIEVVRKTKHSVQVHTGSYQIDSTCTVRPVIRDVDEIETKWRMPTTSKRKNGNE